MDHEWYDYSPIAARTPLAWPEGAAVAFWLVLYLEQWELEPPPGAVRAPGVHGPWVDVAPDVRTFTHREYGNRVGIFRILDALDRFAVPATVAVNSAAAQRLPQLVTACADRGHEIAAHGTHATRMISSRLTEAEERDMIETSLRTVAAVTGIRPAGWVGQDQGESSRTPRLLEEAGVSWLADWSNDDQPFPFGPTRRLVSLPRQTQWDDVHQLWLRHLTMPRYLDVVLEAFRRLARDGEEGGRVFGLGVHPWLLGQPHRFAYLERALAAITGATRVWMATGSQIAAASRGDG